MAMKPISPFDLGRGRAENERDSDNPFARV